MFSEFGERFDTMFQQNLNSNDDDPKDAKGKELLNQKNKRRSKKDKTGRNFICGCGKEYLSYPALYTHIKTKHDGKNPEGTVANQATKTKRGRPKKIDHKAEENRSIPDDNFDNLVPQPIIRVESLAEYALEKNDLRLLKEYPFLGGSCDPTLGFPVMKFCNDDQPSLHPFHTLINALKSESRNESLFNHNYCDTIFSMFLFSVSKLVNEKFYLVLGMFFRNLRECLNEYGYDKINEYFDKHYSEESKSLIPKKKEDRVFCEKETTEFIPVIADTFILEYIPKFCPDFDQQLAVDIMYDFCNWLLKKKFAKVKASFNNSTEPIFVISDDEEDKDKALLKSFGKMK